MPFICNSVVSLCDETFKSCGDVGIDLDDKLTTEMSGITTLKEFKRTVTGEFIDAKGWKTMSAYPTLRMYYERYLDSDTYCTGATSSQFNYCDMIEFSELVGTYWVDLIEQVIPSTTIWGSTYVYSNTIFDQQKFKYRRYSIFGCEEPKWEDGSGDEVEAELPSPTDGEELSVSGTVTTTTVDDKGHEFVTTNTCSGVWVKQMNCGSEFVGRIIDLSNPSDADSGAISVTGE